MNIFQRYYLKILMKTKDWGEEHHFLLGGRINPQKTFYVIRRTGTKLGLFSLFNTNLARIKYAYENNMIPVVDMQYFMNSLLNESNFGKTNSWEYFFEQPAQYTLSDVYKSKHIVLSASGVPDNCPGDSVDFLNNENGILDEWRETCRKYIKIKSSIQQQIDHEYSSLISDGDKVLGVLARGTDYTNLRPSHHPVQPSAGMIINKAKEVMKEYSCNKIFVATEDREIAKLFQDNFGEQYITNKKEFINYSGGYLSENRRNRDNDQYIGGLEYLTSITILSRCNCIVAGRTSGTVGACLLSNGWDYSYFFDLGYYE